MSALPSKIPKDALLLPRECTPQKIHSCVSALCAGINATTIPFFVPVAPEPGEPTNECFLTVRKKVRTHGGSLVHGWRLLEVPGIFVEAEFHGVWLSPSGDYIDVTPSQPGNSQTLFLPDPEKVFDEVTFSRRDNIRLAIKNHPAVHAFLAHCGKIYQYEEAHTDPANPQRFKVDQQEYAQLQLRKTELQMQIAQIPCGRNDPCRCGSGLKHKKCCGR